MMNIQYLAGLFDGEGTIGLYKQRSTGYRRTVGITNTYLPVLQELQEAYGGNIYPQRQATTNHKATWGWEIQRGKNIDTFLTALRPHLRIKAEQTDTMLAYLHGELDQDVAEARLKAIKHRGKLEIAVSTL